MANFRSLSRYTGGIVTKNRSGKNFLILRNQLNLEPSDGDIFVTITGDIANRPDLIAQKAYEDTRLWWVIYEFNDIRDPMFDLRAGMILRLPQLQRVLQAIEELDI